MAKRQHKRLRLPKGCLAKPIPLLTPNRPQTLKRPAKGRKQRAVPDIFSHCPCTPMFGTRTSTASTSSPWTLVIHPSSPTPDSKPAIPLYLELPNSNKAADLSCTRPFTTPSVTRWNHGLLQLLPVDPNVVWSGWAGVQGWSNFGERWLGRLVDQEGDHSKVMECPASWPGGKWGFRCDELHAQGWGTGAPASTEPHVLKPRVLQLLFCGSGTCSVKGLWETRSNFYLCIRCQRLSLSFGHTCCWTFLFASSASDDRFLLWRYFVGSS